MKQLVVEVDVVVNEVVRVVVVIMLSVVLVV